MNKRLVSIMLLAALMLSSASCGGGQSEDTTASTTEPAVTTESVAELVGFPEEDNGGETFTVFANIHKAYEYDAEEQTGDVVSDAVYYKNQAVEDYLGIQFEFVYEDGNWNARGDFNQKIMQDVQSGDAMYDMVSNTLVCTLPLATEGFFLESANLPFMNLDNPWWIKNQHEDLSIAGKLYGFLGDLSLSVYKDITVIYFNKRIWDEYNAENPYDLVRENKWTLDKFHALASSMARDLNGDGKWDFENDQITYLAEVVPNGTFQTALQLKIVEKNADGEIEWLGLTERFADAYEKRAAFMSGEGIGTMTTIDDSSFRSMKTFANGNVATMCNFIYSTEYLRDMKDDYGIVPMPKYDDMQKDYTCQMGTSTCMVFAPVSVKNPELTSKAMELLAYYTNQLVVPKYYEVALKEKYARDTDIAEMLDIIRDGAAIDFAFVYGMQVSGFPANLFRLDTKPDPGARKVGAANLASQFESGKKRAETSLAELTAKYATLEH
ncbi:MAG: extracellular solute-binding protein [Ruminococcaceae bacterium]|nr:extracellular solute-binding protein [Oscillospiraceae bacterium]